MEKVVVTGPTAGIGRAAAIAIAASGRHVIAAGRSREKLEALMREIDAAGGSAEWVQMDLASLRSVTGAATEILDRHGRIDVLVNNAGVGASTGATRDGFQIQFGVNHLGHFHLTELLAPALGPGARVVQLSSEMHRGAKGIDFARVRRPTRPWEGLSAYAASKLANLVFARELARRRPGIRTYAVHPGLVDTGIFPRVVRPFLRNAVTPEEGADTVVFCATDPGVADSTGGYWAKRKERDPDDLARDERLAEELWARSEEWCRPFH
jgi:retinol dehydrogenase-12